MNTSDQIQILQRFIDVLSEQLQRLASSVQNCTTSTKERLGVAEKLIKKRDKKIENTRKSAYFAVYVAVDAKKTSTVLMKTAQEAASEVVEDVNDDDFVVPDEFNVTWDSNSADNVADDIVISDDDS